MILCLKGFFENGGIDRNEFDKSLDEYCLQRGWDESGAPTERKLRELGII